MNHRSVSDGVPLDRQDLLGHDAPGSWWLSADSWSSFPPHTGDNSAGNGGNGYFAGSLIDRSYAAFEPLNVAQARSHATADAHQTNTAYFDQSATQIAGVGGDGGDGNSAIGGDVYAARTGHTSHQSIGGAGLARDHGSIGSDVIASGANHAGNGGDGYFYGGLVHASFALYYPINI